MHIAKVRDQLRGISSDRAVGLGPGKVLSLPDAIGQALESYMSEKHGVQETLPLTATVGTDGSQVSSVGDSDQETAFLL